MASVHQGRDEDCPTIEEPRPLITSDQDTLFLRALRHDLARLVETTPAAPPPEYRRYG